MMVRKICFIALISLATLTAPMQKLTVCAQDEGSQPNQVVIPFGENESVIVDLLSTLPPENGLYVNDEEELAAYLFDGDKLYLLYKNQESANDWSNSSIATVGEASDFEFSRISQQFMDQLSELSNETVVELSPVIYYFADMTRREDIEFEGEIIGLEYQSNVIQAKDSNGNDIDLRLNTDDSWEEFVDLKGNEYQLFEN